MFWNIWRNEYLTSLRERTQTKLKDGRVHSHCSPKVNDVVLIKEDTARGNWRFATVIRLVKGRDGLVRSAKVRLPSGKEIGRPINLLYPLELSCEEQKKINNNKTKNDGPERPKRNAAKTATERIKGILSTS